MRNKNRIKDFAFAMGSFSGGLSGYVMGSWYVYFYVDKLGLSLDYFATAMVIYGIWNAINDPLMGILSDRTKSRMGRRKPYMLFGALPLGLSLIFLFWPVDGMFSSQTGMFIYFVMALCLFDTFFTMTMLAWSAVIPEMYLDQKNRARVNTISQILGVVGAILATLLVETITNALGFRIMAILFAVVTILTMMLSAWGVRERGAAEEKTALNLWQSIAATFTNKSFLVCVVSVLLVEIGKVIFQSTMPFYSEYVIKSPLGVTLIMGAVFGSVILFAPLVAFLSNRFGNRNSYIFATIVFSLAAMGFFFAPNIIVAVIVAVIAGFGVAGVMILPNMLYAEIIDEDQIRTGTRRDGTFFGMNALVMRLSVVIQGFVTTAVFTRTGYVAKQVEQTASAVQGIRFLIGLVPLFFAVLAVIVLFFYPINKERLQEIHQKMLEMNPEVAGDEHL